jgi:hypothetical protein
MIFDILDAEEYLVDEKINGLFSSIHKNGPISQSDLSELALIKHFRSSVFEKNEAQLMYLLGLFYKTSEPKDLLSFTYTLFHKAIQDDTGNNYTPIQYCIYKDIKDNKVYSFSAPTSAGKSFLLRKLISEVNNDVVVVVPSRALMAEYVFVLRETFKEDKEILILSFVEDINKNRTRKRIFVLTPERVAEVYRCTYNFNVSMFLFDEAQLADDKIRGINFANIVKKSEIKYPTARKIFAHPFIENPEIQLEKLKLEGKSRNYPQNTVGKIFVTRREDGDYLFNPFDKKPHLKKNLRKVNDDLIETFLSDGKTVLFFVSKKDITEKRILERFSKYIETCNSVTDPEAITIIKRIQELLNSTEDGESMLISLLKRGIVIHHGSIPLDVRFLLEHFTNKKFAKICFSTSTLLQGINMPFDAIYIDNFRFYGDLDAKNLGLKNLIGRAGRTTQKEDCFDYGFVIVNNAKEFSKRLKNDSKLNSESVLDQIVEEGDSFLRESIDAVKNNSVDDETNEPVSRLNRLQNEVCQNHVRSLLDNFFVNGTMKTYGSFSDSEKNVIKEAYQAIFESYIGRALFDGEKSIFKSGLNILLWQIQGNSFKKILNLRYTYIAQGNYIRSINRKFRNQEITKQEKLRLLNQFNLEFSPIPSHLPDRTKVKCPPSTFAHKTLSQFDYDTLVYDTYDYVDKVVDLSLKGPFIAAFKTYSVLTNDSRAEQMINYLQYGTSDQNTILLKKYGFSDEQIETISDMVLSVDENKISFNMEQIAEIDDPVLKELVERYCF